MAYTVKVPARRDLFLGGVGNSQVHVYVVVQFLPLVKFF